MFQPQSTSVMCNKITSLYVHFRGRFQMVEGFVCLMLNWVSIVLMFLFYLFLWVHHCGCRSQKGLWLHQDLHSAVGLKFQWGGSHSSRTLLRCLGVDATNIVSCAINSFVLKTKLFTKPPCIRKDLCPYFHPGLC